MGAAQERHVRREEDVQQRLGDHSQIPWKWKAKACVVKHMATIIKLRGESAKQALLNWALRLSSQGAKREWPRKRMRVYSCATELRVCFCMHLGYVCVQMKMAACVPRRPLYATTWSSVHVWFGVLACVCTPVIYAGKLVIIMCFVQRDVCSLL